MGPCLPRRRISTTCTITVLRNHKNATIFIMCPKINPVWQSLTHLSRVTHICVSKLTIISSANGLLPEWRQAIIWTNAGILLIGPLGTIFSEILIGIQTFLCKKMHLTMSSAKWHPCCLCLNILINTSPIQRNGQENNHHNVYSSHSSLLCQAICRHIMKLWILYIQRLFLPEKSMILYNILLFFGISRNSHILLWNWECYTFKGYFCMWNQWFCIISCYILVFQETVTYCHNIRCTKSQNLNVSHLILQLSLPNPLRPGVKSRMKM